MEENNKNFVVALLLSVVVFLIWHFVFVAPKQEEARIRQEQEALIKTQNDAKVPSAPVTTKAKPQSPLIVAAPVVAKDRKSVIASSDRVAIDTPALQGSISLKGGRIDDVSFKKYHTEVAKSSPLVELFSPAGTKHPYFAEFGWSSAGSNEIKLPNSESVWRLVSGSTLTPDSPVTIEYDAGNGVVFQRDISVDDKYMFTVTQRVVNNSPKDLSLSAYGYLWRQNKPFSETLFISHEGAVGAFDEEVNEITYGDLETDQHAPIKAKTGWTGLADKYWAAALIPDERLPFTASFRGDNVNNNISYQTTYILNGQLIGAGKTVEISNRLFAGAKQGRVIEAYAEIYKIARFENLIDWGWFHFITKPMFHLLVYINDLIGNFGFAILIVTVLIKMVLFPLANKSYKSMAMMKKMQPEMEKLKVRYKDDKMKQQQALMELYKKEKINPLSGCWPIMVQIPIFFALYKVLYTTIEMRHAPFIGWIHDLSAPDPSNIFTLFGLLPFDPPSFLMLGVWPIIMGITMFVQMKLNPAPTDPVQAKIFTYMPIAFTFILAGFSAGLVIYWAWNNFLSVLQQYTIMKRHGVEVTLMENIGFRKNKDKDKD